MTIGEIQIARRQGAQQPRIAEGHRNPSIIEAGHKGGKSWGL